MLLMLSISAHAQQDVTKFLGIPVDGSKTEMISKLKEKGFRYDPTTDCLIGEFNGASVYISVVTNNNKVWRIWVADATTFNEQYIKNRFNALCMQFANNPKYITLPLAEDYTIPIEEDIFYEMTINKKCYEAAFYQFSGDARAAVAAILEKAKSTLSYKYTEKQLENPTEKIKEEIVRICMTYIIEYVGKKSVWFMISGNNGEYRIIMFYDNEYNMANGEDL